MPRKSAEKFRAAFLDLAADPYHSNHDTMKLSGRDGYRLRIGGYRAIYTIDDDQLVILVVNIGSRGEIYK